MAISLWLFGDTLELANRGMLWNLDITDGDAITSNCEQNESSSSFILWHERYQFVRGKQKQRQSKYELGSHQMERSHKTLFLI